MGDFLRDFQNVLTKFENVQGTNLYRRQDKPEIPVKLIKPSVGRIVKIEVIEPNDYFAQFYMEQLKIYAENLKQIGADWKIEGKTIQIIFDDDDMAKIIRQIWE